MSQPIAWTIAGSDSGGNAGMQADFHTFQSLGVHACSVITAVTAQSQHIINAIHYLPTTLIHSQIETLATVHPAIAIKIGMLGTSEIIKTIQPFLQNYSGWVVLDPVCVATSGKNLFSSDIKNYLDSIKTLFTCIDILTPNLLETEMLLGCKITSFQEIVTAADEIIRLGVKNVLIKGGHFKNDGFSQDYWTNGKESFWLSAERVAQDFHGTGCTLSSAITACLALGYTIKDSLVIGKMYISQCIRHALESGSISLSHQGWPEKQMDLPNITAQPISSLKEPFPACNTTPLGLYPVVDNVTWLERLLPLGVTTIQLRIKDKKGNELANEIKQAIMLANKFQARLFINDYWEQAVLYGAYGVHLGQEDLNHADINLIRHSGLRLGISTHCYYEVARAHAFRPSYIACGPIFTTTSKIMPFLPQGILQLERWRRTLSYPLIAIGGINHLRLPRVLATGVDGIALISAITQAQDPIEITKQLLNRFPVDMI